MYATERTIYDRLEDFEQMKTDEQMETLLQMKESQELLQMFDNLANDSYLEVAHLLAKATDDVPLWKGDAIDNEAFVINKLLTNYVQTKSFEAIHAHLKKSSNKEQTLRIMNVLAENHDLCTSAYSNTLNKEEYTKCVKEFRLFDLQASHIHRRNVLGVAPHQVSVPSYGGKK